MMCIQDELGQLSTIAGDPVLSVTHRVQIPNCSNINSESNTDSSESTNKPTVAPETVYSQRPFAWIAGCMQPVFNLINKVTFSEKIKGSQSKLLKIFFNS
jgi:mitogen-activated protein kinase kinase kinase 13